MDTCMNFQYKWHNFIMHPQILRTWPQGRQALVIRAHNLFQNNGKTNLFSPNWSDNDANKNRLQDFYDIFDLHV